MGTYSIYSGLDAAGSTFTNEGDVTFGNRFRSTVDGDITHIRFWKVSVDSCAAHNGAIWTNAGTRLGIVTFTGETGSGWQTMALASPIAITAGTTYLVTVNHEDGDYITQDGFFTGASWSAGGPLVALADGFDGDTGVYEYTTNLATFPTTTDFVSGPVYYVDLIFDDGVTAGDEPKLREVGALFAAASGTSITPVIPASAVTGDIMLMGAMCNGSTTFSTPTDWTVLGTSVESNANQSTAWFWKRHDGSETDPTSTTSATLSGTVGGYGRIWVFQDCLATGDPFEDVTMAGTPTTSTTPASAEITTTGDDRLAVCLLMVDDDNQWVSGQPPLGWYNAGPRLVSTVGGDAMFDAISRVIPAAGTVTAVTVGTMGAADYWRTLTLALLPAATGTNAPAGNAAATGAAADAIATISPAAGHASATGAASSATTTIAPTAGNAAATGTALDPQVAVGPATGNAAGTGVAHDATVTTSAAETDAPAGNAAATGTANTATTRIAPSAGNAAATGAAFDATSTIAPQAGNAGATAAAHEGTVQTGSFTNADAGTAAATGAAADATTTISATVDVASATGTAHDARAAVGPSAGHAAATGSAFDATIAAAVTAIVATAVGLAHAITANIAPQAGNAAATGTAHDATATNTTVDYDHPITATVRSYGHTATVTAAGHTATIRNRGHTTTVREQR